MVNWKFKYAIGDTKKLVKKIGERGKKEESEGEHMEFLAQKS